MAQIQITANGSKGYHQFVLTVSESSVSTENNTSIVHFELKLKPLTTGRKWSALSGSDKTISYTISIGGTQMKGTIQSYDGTSTVMVDGGNLGISHNSDGTKTISCFFNVTDTTDLANACGNASGRGVLELTAIERPITGGAPVIEASVVDTNPTTINLTGSKYTLIKYHSTAEATMTATAQGGAVMNNDVYVIRNGNKTEFGTTGYFENVESNTFTFSAEDSAGRIGTATVTADMVDYVRLTCNMGNSRPDANGNMALRCSGNCFNGSFGRYGNDLTVRYRYTGSNGTSGSGYMTASRYSDNTYEASVDLILNYEVTYSFVITATDSLDEVESNQSGVKSKPVFHWGESDFVFEVPVTLNGNLDITGDLRLKKPDSAYGNTLRFGDGSHAYISEPSDDALKIYARCGINLETDGYHDVLINGSPIGSSGGSGGGGSSCDCVYGEWTPRFTNETPLKEDYVARSGWYQKVGNVVTIGWYLEANVYTGHTTTELKIAGCPFGAAYHSFGGGIMYGPYIAAGLAFEGWVLNGNTISARLQPCNNTSAGDLNISQNVYFPKNTSPVKLSGTICFMTNS